MTDKIPILLNKIYTSFMDLMFYSNDPVDLLNNYVVEDVMGYGTTLDEKVFDLKGLKDLANLQRDQSPGLKFKHELIPVYRKLMNKDNIAIIVDEINISMQIEGNEVILNVRMSMVWEFLEENWKLVHWHGSKPEYDSGGADTWHKEEWKQKNEALQKLVEEKTSDLEKKNKELKIESSLERIRTIAMGMQKAEGLLDVVEIFYIELNTLGFTDIRNTIINIFNDSKEHFLNYDYSDYGVGGINEVDYNSHPKNKDFVNKMREASTGFMISEFTGNELDEWRKWRIDEGQMPDSKLDQAESLYYYEYSIGVGTIGVSTFSSINDDQLKILNKIRNVFDLAYRRYADIEQAEAHAREAKIEAALERVRSIAMGMQKPDDLLEVCQIISEQLESLNVSDIRNIQLAIIDESKKNYLNYQYFTPYSKKVFEITEYKKNPTAHAMVKEMQKSANSFFTGSIKGKAIQEFREWRKKYNQFLDPLLDKSSAVHYYFYSIGQGGLGLTTYKEISSENHKIFKRFHNVFKLAYRRYLDIEKAEAQIREAQIEAALERVRAASMAMHKSEQLSETATVMFQQLCSLGQIPDRLGIVIYNEQQQSFESWTTDQSGMQLTKAFNASSKEPTTFSKIYKAWKGNKDLIIIDLTGKELKNWLRFVKENMKLPIKESNIKNQRVHYAAFFSHGCLMCTFHKPSEHNFNQLLVRFAKVFDQTYTRFLDLKNAEAQAREAQIDAALERTRSHSMQMQQSEEIKDLSKIFHEQLTSLNIPSEFSYIWLPEEEKDEHMFWATWSETKKGETTTNSKSVIYPLDKTEPYTAACFDAWDSNIPVHVTKIPPKEVAQFFTTWKDLIKGAKNLKARNFPEGIYYAESYMKYGCFGINIRRTLTKEEQNILLRFTIEFERAYTRFLDLKKAEEQAREAKIEAALEKVRSRSIGMQKSEELKEVIQVIHDQLIHLNFKIDAAGFTMDYFQNNDWNIWIANKEQSLPTQIYIPYIDHPQFNFYKGAKEKGLDFFANTLSFEDKNSIFNYMFEFMGDYPQAERDQVLSAPGLAISQAFLKNITLWIYNLEGNPYTEEDNNILMRFARVFEQTYVRFNDLQKAETQAREAQIELALERIRARVTAMSESSELLDIVVMMRTEFVSLGHDAHYFWYMRYHPETYEKAMTSGDGTRIGMVMSLPRHIHGDIKLIDDWEKSDEPTVVFAMDVETAVDYIHKMITLGDFKQVDPNAPTLDDIRHIGGLTFIMARTTHGEIGFSLPGTVPNPPQEDLDTLVRFAGVFDLAYRRFEDLKSAEQRNRETQIELALERVRSKTMAMHNSHDMAITVTTLFDEVLKLGLDNDIRCGIGILEGTERMETRSATLDNNGEVDLKIGMLDMTIHPLLKRIKNGWERHKTHFVDQMAGKDVFRYYTALNNEPDYPFLRDLNTLPEIEYHNSFSFPEGIIFCFSPNPMSVEAAKVFERFARVFGQTYRRYRDLLHAEEQAREAKIEAALERIRTQAMAMQHSDDLIKSTTILFEELEKLKLPLERCGIGIFDKETRDCQLYTTVVNDEGKTELATGITSLTIHPMLIKTFDAWIVQKSLLYVLEGKELEDYYKLISKSRFHLPEDVINKSVSLVKEYYFYTPFGAGGLYVFSDIEPTKEEIKVIRRFAEVFHMTYTRYEDLQKAEARALEAVKQASLDRVRGEIASMRTAEDMNRITPLIWKELETLEVPFNRCGVFIVDKEQANIKMYLTTPDGSPLGVLDLPTDSNEMSQTIFTHWQKKSVFKLHWNKKDFMAWMQSMIDLGQIQNEKQYQGNVPPPKSLDLHFIPFKQGMLYVGNNEPLLEEKIELVKSLAKTFSVAYARYEDFKQLENAKNKIEITLKDLKATQTQLVHSEKMASLGELTAGIAHEIQNPLNFVNNFSEVSVDLMEELGEEMATGNKEEVNAIAEDIKQNLEKITDHGKRASFIVKGMLEHSRTNTGEKKSTDINALADEYLRLAYHGLRAKDKSFNADFTTEFDENLPKINVISQDLGRVILNLINNAFFAVSEASAMQTAEKSYKPQVIISTKQVNDKIEIMVKDNGNGIPKDIKDKIFQPFFTTKPTGQGTGLGLSMSYDIITKGHGGKLKVESKENKGTTFIISIPFKI